MNKKSAKTQFIIGTSGWNYPDWRGSFYPKGLAQKNWLAFYTTKFPIVEINATFYRLFGANVFKNWHEKAKGKFKYIVKVNRYITHRKYLKNSKTAIKKFCRSTALLKNKQALMLLQLPPSMPYDLERLQKALMSFDNPKKVVVEFRHRKWLTLETKQLLKKMGCVFCAADSPQTELVAWVTAKTAYIRLHGRKKWFDYNYTKTELGEIARFARKLAKQGANKIYILFNNDYYCYAVKNAIYLNSLLNVKKRKLT